MKICLINNLYKPFNRGGAERMVEIIAKELHASGHEIFIVATAPSIEKKPEFADYEINYIDNIRVYFIKTLYYNLHKIPIIARLFWHFWDMFDVISANKIKNIIKNEKPDLVITNNLKGISLLLPKEISKLKIKHIHILHDMQLLYPSGVLLYGQESKLRKISVKFYIFLCAYLFADVKNIVSPSKWLMHEHEKRNFFKISKKMIIRSPFIIRDSQMKKNDHDAGNKKFIFLYIGQIEKHKGVFFLIENFNKFSKNNLNVELHLTGGGTEVQNAKILANDKIFFHEQAEHNEVIDLMKKSDCLVVPSLCYENSPTVIYEAVAVGLPVVASRIGGITELIQDYGGVLFEPGNGLELAAKLDWILANGSEIKKRYFNKYQEIKKNNRSEYVKKIIDAG